MTHTRRLTLTATAVVLAATLTACSGDADAPTAEPDQATASETSDADSEGSVHNDADTEFAQMMIVHHEGAIEMAELAAQRATTPEVTALAERIAGAQGPEIELMTSWLETWDEQLPSEAEMGSMDHGPMEMDGMDQEAVMEQLTSLSGTEFDRRFLELMTDHHRGAIEMSEEFRAAGQNAAAIQLAGAIIDAQTVEITEMENLRQGL
ncbi:DUF305 domain-containing protein [Cellulomonas sp. KRMCY2]|uniref:DUF305 domain-containing protein n=1 Tax=Cellulomonas sp. KRMCY2 TaxID=1304865 RepID=UPI00045EC4F9|nr:DUF305 domain-containing protein [Cellulomonas sp. KRMCY2]